MKRLISLAFIAGMAASACPDCGICMASNDHRTDPDHYYLNSDQLPSSVGLIQIVPDTTSARFAYDHEQYEWGKTMRATERGRQAVVDADLSEGWLDRSFGKAFGMPLTKESLPETYKLLMTMKDDAGHLAPMEAKAHYQRTRPFVFWKEPTTTPWDEDGLSKNGSYPSGHTSIGWATALVLAEINPARMNEILQRGFEYGQSRVIVGAHYQSDVDAGRVIGAAAVAMLHTSDDFQAQLAKAKAEVKQKLKGKANKNK